MGNTKSTETEIIFDQFQITYSNRKFHKHPAGFYMELKNGAGGQATWVSIVVDEECLGKTPEVIPKRVELALMDEEWKMVFPEEWGYENDIKNFIGDYRASEVENILKIVEEIRRLEVTTDKSNEE